MAWSNGKGLGGDDKLPWIDNKITSDRKVESDCKGFRNDCGGFRNDLKGFRNDLKVFRNDFKRFRNNRRGGNDRKGANINFKISS